MTPPDSGATVLQRYEEVHRQRDAALEVLKARLAQFRPEPRVLLIDDNLSLVCSIAQLLERETGVATVIETDAERGLKIAREAQPGEFAAAMLDLYLNHPTLSGLDVAEALPRDVGIYLITGAAPEVLHECGARVSAIHLLVKPPTSEDLHAVCADIRRRIRKEPFTERPSSLPPPTP